MKAFRKWLASGALAAGLAFAGSAQAGFLSFFFDADGPAGASAFEVGEFLDFTGAVYASNTYTSATDFTFNQFGYAEVTGSDSVSNGAFRDNNIVASYFGPGVGSLETGRASFTGGEVNLFSGGFGGALIASFEIIGGGSIISPVSGAPNGASSLNARATFFAPGYFFSNANGNPGFDFSMLDLENELLFGFASSNLSLTTTTIARNAQRGMLVQAFPSQTFSTNAAGNANNLTDGQRLLTLYSGGNGQFRLQVPEPGALALVGLGLLGLGAVRRRRAA